MGLDDRTRSLTSAVGRGTRKDDALIYHLPELGDHVRFTPSGFNGWVSGTVCEVKPTGGIVIDCGAEYGCYSLHPSYDRVVVYRRAGE
jgi:hypothetical protein